MNVPMVSVIVPVYNVQGYLEKCVRSICAQSYTNLQIILVNDGSTDASGVICDELLNIDERIIVVHKQNGGLASARNRGMEEVRGEFLTFIDSDDYVGRDYIQNLFDAAYMFKADLVITGLCRLSQIKNTTSSNYQINYKVLTPEEAIKESIQQHLFGEHACGRLYASRLFNHLIFSEGKNFEDAPVSCRVLYNSKKIIYEDACDYYYLDNRQDSITNAFTRKYIDCLDSFWDVYTFVKANAPSAAVVAENRYFGRLIRCLGVAYLAKEAESIDFVYRKIVKVRAYVLLKSKCPVSTRCAYFFSLFSKRLISYLAAKII